MTSSPRSMTAIAAIAGLLSASLLSGCSFAPKYHVPGMAAVPASFKELPGWQQATPSDAVAKGDWWMIFNDPILDALERKVLVSNQNLAASKAAYDQAQAMVREQRAATLPSVSLAGKAQDAASFKSSSSSSSTTVTPGSGSVQSKSTAFSLGLTTTWEPELWFLLDNAVRQSKIQAQASAGDLMNATLSAQGELALDYVQLRGLDAQKLALDQTVADYARALTITTNLYNAGVSARSDVLQAQTALSNARGDAQDLVRQRAILEHAIAVLIGENPSTFTLAPTDWNKIVPAVPSLLPSQLLQRRPDVAAAERRVAAANIGIGIQKGAFFPTFSLTGEAGQSANGLGSLFSVASSAWSLGLSGALTLLDFGARSAKIAAARAAYEQAVATYRQTALTAFQQTEDQLAAVRVLRGVADERTAAASAATRAEQIAQNQYKAGQIAYSSVIVTQTTALSARTADIQATVNQQVAAISLIQAIGGHWESSPAIPIAAGH